MKQRSTEALGGIPLGGDLMPMESAGRVLAGLGRDFLEDMSRPAARAGFCTSLLTSALLAKRLGMLPTIVIAVMAGVSVEHLYGMAEDIHEKVTAPYPPLLNFHGIVGCPGHEPGKTQWSEECPDVPRVD